ncbi:MAG: glycosyltransferase, partial [Thermoplasmataceae archaeon]
GWINDDNFLSTLYSNSIFVNTGLNETLPMPPLEAMACGGTVVMSSNGGSSEYVDNMKNCVLVNPGNDVELTKALDLVLSSQSLRNELRIGAIKSARKYTWESVLKNFLGLIKKEN